MPTCRLVGAIRFVLFIWENLLTLDLIFLDSGIDGARLQCCSKATESVCWRLCVKVCTTLNLVVLHLCTYPHRAHEDS